MTKEYEILAEKLNEIIPFNALPTRELAVALRGKMPVTLKSNLLVDSIHNSGDAGGIVCAIKMENNEVLACSLTHLIIPAGNPLYKEIVEYQKKRIKRLKKYY